MYSMNVSVHVYNESRDRKIKRVRDWCNRLNVLMYNM